MASSKRSLDLDSLTYQDLYTKSQNLSLISTLTIPVIQVTSNVYTKFQYLTPQQALSTNNVIITTSTIPNILNSIDSISTQQSAIEIGMSTLSSFVANSISTVQFTTNSFSTSANLLTYNTPQYSNIVTMNDIINDQNIATLGLNLGLRYLGSGISSLSSQFNPLFCSLAYSVQNTFNQGPAVSTLSTFITRYYIGISTNITNYSTSTGLSISSLAGQNQSSFTSYFQLTSTATNYVASGTASTLSTIITSTIGSYYSTIRAYDPTLPLGNLSSYVNESISSLSSYYYLNTGISGICSMSTVLNEKYLNSITNAQNLAGTPGLCTMSTYLYGITEDIQAAVSGVQNNLICSFSTVIYNEIKFINKQISTVGYAYLLLDNEAVRVSLSTLSTSFGNNYKYLTSLSTFSTILPSVYSTVNTIFSQNFTNTLSTLLISSLNVQSTLYTSSIGIQTSTSTQYPFSMVGAAKFITPPNPSINHLFVGQANPNTILLNTGQLVNPGFTISANDVAYNGSIWVIVGDTDMAIGSPIKFSADPAGTWTDAIVPNGPYSVLSIKWSGTYWLAGTNVTSPSLLSSIDGITWSDVSPVTTLQAINSLAWNGFTWASVGSNTPFSTIQYTDSNGTWQSATNSFSLQGNAIATNGRTWVSVGQGVSTMKYSYDAANWLDVAPPNLSTGLTVAWNGSMFLAGGSNGNSSNLMYSYTGAKWTYINGPPCSTINSIIWDSSNWNASATSGANQQIFTSADTLNWTSSITSLPINAIAYSSNTIPTIQLSNFDIFSGEMPVLMNSRNRMNIIQSTIYFNDGNLTIRKQLANPTIANIGINTTYPEYALDIAVGDARKPSGTAWITASDARVKTNIVTADLERCAKAVSEIPLRKFNFIKEFREKSGLGEKLEYGFIAQEVKQVLPNSVTYTSEHGLEDFHSLDTDQLYKIEFGATQYLLNTVKILEAQVSTLEANRIMRTTI